eukprot:1376869-Pleurochrysis_carterae.AAC.2
MADASNINTIARARKLVLTLSELGLEVTIIAKLELEVTIIAIAAWDRQPKKQKQPFESQNAQKVKGDITDLYKTYCVTIIHDRKGYAGQDNRIYNPSIAVTKMKSATSPFAGRVFLECMPAWLSV